jgi:GNAT superfamily N-acetyltransferase
MLTLRQPGSDADHAAIRQLCRAYRDSLARRAAPCPDIVEMYYSEKSYEALLMQLPQLHARPDGALFLALLGDRPVGCGMTRRIDTRTSEIKRVYVTPAARGHGAARAIVGAAIDQARADGYARMALDTMAWLTEAIALYESLGFAPCAPFHDPGPEFAPFIRFYDRAL